MRVYTKLNNKNITIHVYICCSNTFKETFPVCMSA